MYGVRDKWTDERLDDLKDGVDDGFSRMDQRFAQMDQRFAQMDQRFAQMDQRFDAQQKLQAQTTLALATVMVSGFIGLATLILAQG
jgi:flagellar capping protein FliD